MESQSMLSEVEVREIETLIRKMHTPKKKTQTNCMSHGRERIKFKIIFSHIQVKYQSIMEWLGGEYYLLHLHFSISFRWLCVHFYRVRWLKSSGAKGRPV